MLVFISVITICILNFVLGVFTLIRNPKSTQYRIFGLFVLFVISWALLNYFSNITTEHVEVLSRAAFVAALMVTVMIYMFSWVFPASIKIQSYQKYLLLLVPILTFITAWTPLVLGKLIGKNQDGSYNIASGPFYLVLIGYLILLFSISMWNFSRSYHNSLKIDKARIRLVVIGIAISYIFIAITSALIPFITNDWAVSKIGPTGTIIMVGAIAYAIIRHKLFDIRLIVARSLGYILTIATLVGVYAFLIAIVSSRLFTGDSVSTGQTLLFVATTLVFGFSLPPLKRFFDKQTNRLFYRDAYDSQLLLDELNKILVGNIDIQPLLRQCSELFERTLKAELCTFIIRETDNTIRRSIGSGNTDIHSDEIIELIRAEKVRTQMVVSDEIEDTTSKLKSALVEDNISILARLAPAGKNAKVLGYLVLGNKKSGNPFNKQDLQVLEIIVNELVIAIQNALRFEEIQEFTVTLQEKVDDATKDLRKANDKLKALDETKDEFISMASHQLRTPLTSVKGYVSMVVEGDAGKITKQQKELLNQAFSSSQRMVYLIADLLNVSRLRTGKFVIENKPTQLADVIEGEMAQLKEVASGKNQTLTYDKPDKFPVLSLDETKIRQVIMNFTDNALHYTPNDGHINVKLEDLGKSIQFTVVDDGLGVPKNEQHHLFSKFYRAGNAKKARPDGTGLGLFMAKKVIIAQGGAIIFKSEENKGSTFGFTFPKEKVLAKNAK